MVRGQLLGGQVVQITVFCHPNLELLSLFLRVPCLKIIQLFLTSEQMVPISLLKTLTVSGPHWLKANSENLMIKTI